MQASPSPTSTGAVEDLVTALYRLGIVQREIARHALAGLGTQGFTALAIARRDGPVRVSDIAERLRIDLSVASRQVAALVAAGYAEREPDPDDRRAFRVTATELGARGAARVAPPHGGRVRRAARGLAGGRTSPRSPAGLDRLRDDFADPVPP